MKKITIAQINPTIGDFEGNYELITQAINQANTAHSDIIIFPGMVISGTPTKDLLRYADFRQQAKETLSRVARYAQDKLTVVLGDVDYAGAANAHFYPAAFWLADGEIQFTARQKKLNDEDIYADSKYFTAGAGAVLVEWQGKQVYLVCGNDFLLSDQPNQKVDLVINPVAIPFTKDIVESNRQTVKTWANRLQATIVQCNQVGAQTDIIFPGMSCVVGPTGAIFKELKTFEQDIITCDWDEVIDFSGTDRGRSAQDSIAWIHDALILGIRDYFAKNNFKKAIVGLSGGVDSALVLALAVEAIGAENVFSVLMPSQFSSDHSVSDAEDLLKRLQSSFTTVPIQNAFQAFEDTLAEDFKGLPADVTEENLQARIRGVYLMAFANKLGYILLNTTNRSEAAVGYGTLYGDTNGALGVIGDLFKTEVYALCAYINREQEIIPRHILTKAPSAELRPGQKDSDSLPDYETLDRILRFYLEEYKSLEEIVQEGFDPSLVSKTLRLSRRAEFKRHQTPPYLRVSRHAFGDGRQMPIVAKS